MAERTPRELDTRARAERPKNWMPPELLPVPREEAGYSYRWIRVSTLGTDDPKNISSKLRDRWRDSSTPTSWQTATEKPSISMSFFTPADWT